MQERLGAPKEGFSITAVQIGSGKVVLCRSCFEASKITGVAKSNILTMVSKGPTRTIRTGWIFFKTP